MEGDHEAFARHDLGVLQSAGVVVADLERKVKIQAIPRVLGGIKQASYEQVG